MTGRRSTTWSPRARPRPGGGSGAVSETEPATRKKPAPPADAGVQGYIYLSSKPKVQDVVKPDAVDAQINDTQIGYARPIVLGRVQYTPKLIGAEIVSGLTLWLGYLLGEGEILALDSFMLDEYEVYAASQSWCTVTLRTGTTAQTEIADMPATAWTSKYPGFALVVCEINLLSAQLGGGIPTARCVVRGLKCYDPRTNSTEWTENPVLIARQLLVSDEYGAGVNSSAIDDTRIATAADLCDGPVGTILEDDFDRADSGTVGSDWTESSGTWEIASNDLKCTAAGNVVQAATQSNGYWRCTVYIPDDGGTATRAAGIQLRKTAAADEPATSGYFLAIKANGTLEFRTPADGVVWTYATGVTPTAVGTALTIAVWAYDDYFVFLVDDSVVGYWHDTNARYSGGYYGLAVETGIVDARFEDFGLYTEPRYRCSAIVADRIDVWAVLADVLEGACPGRYWYSDGKWRITVDGTGSSAWTINDDGSSGGLQIIGVGGKAALSIVGTAADRPNMVSAQYIDQSEWMTKDVYAEAAELQAGTEQPRVVSLGTLPVPSAHQAYRLCQQVLARMRRTTHYTARVGAAGIQIAPGDIGTLNSAVGPVSSQTVRVQAVVLERGAYAMELVDYNAADYYSGLYTEDAPALSDIDNARYRFVTLADEFRFGGTADGDIGELLWNAGLAPTVTYLNEDGHPGILHFTSGDEIAKDDAANLFIPQSTWSMRAVWRAPTAAPGATSASTIGADNAFLVRAYGANRTLGYGATTTGAFTSLSHDLAADDWVFLDVTCDASGNIEAKITVRPAAGSDTVLTVSTSTAVATQTGHLVIYRAGGGEIDADYIGLVLRAETSM